MTALASAALLPWLGAAVMLATAMAAAVAYFRASLARTTIEVYKADNDALRGRVDTLEDEKNRLITEGAARDAKLGTLEERNRDLTDLLSGRAELSSLAKQITDHHTEMMNMLGRVLEKVA